MDYILQKSQRSKITLIIERDNSLVVRAPLKASDDDVHNFMKRKRIRIYKKFAEKKYMQFTDSKKQYVNGEGFLYLGRSYKLEVVDEQEQALRLYKNRFLLRRDMVECGEESFIEWYIRQGNDRIEQRLANFQKKIGRIGLRGGVKDLQYRWGSCTPTNKLYFHWKVVLAPLDVIDYIVAHELIHVVEKKHTKKFWDMMAIAMPGYEKHKEWLKKHGGDLVL